MEAHELNHMIMFGGLGLSLLLSLVALKIACNKPKWTISKIVKEINDLQLKAPQ